MNYKIISSGSKGNCTILEDVIAIDMGVSYSKIKDYAKALKVVLLTHCHSDHFKATTISKLNSEHPNIKFICADYLVNELSNLVPIKNIYVLETNKMYDLGLCKLAMFPLIHDVPNVGYRIEINGHRCIYATDTRSIDHVVAKNYDLYLVEGNYTEEDIQERIKEKEANGEYIYEYRVIKNHMSQEQLMTWLLDNIGPNSEYVRMHQHEDEK